MTGVQTCALPISTLKVPGLTTPAPTSTPTATSLASSSSKDTGIPWLNATPSMLYNMPNLSAYLAKEAAREKNKDILTQLEPSLAEEFRSRGYGEDNVEPTYGYASGGSTTSTSGLMDLSDPKSLPFVNTAPAMLQGSPVARRTPATPNPLRQLYSKMSSHDMGMAKGGLPHKYAEAAPDGHNPEFITGLTGYYASGGGTGQSDDIPAMLHDGDYVMDAETVSALGDGSSKAGREVLDGFRSKVPHRDRQEGSAVPAKIADGEYVFPAAFVTSLGNGDNKRGAKILDGLREKLREHKRSAPSTKIPPKAKSPLDYIKQAKG